MELMRTTRRLALEAAGIVALAMCCPTVHAGDYSWTQDKVSPAINYHNVAVVTPFAPDAASSIAPGSRITAVHAARSYKGTARVQTDLCWNGMSRCVHVTGDSVNTHEFDGLDPGKPMYLVHKALGDQHRPLLSPVFVKGSVAVWYAP